jgi:TctA family transporter
MGYTGIDNNNSSMRLNFILLTIISGILLLAVAVYIILNSIKCNLIDWSGMGVFVGMLIGGLSGMGFAKAQQKKWEVNERNTEKNSK